MLSVLCALSLASPAKVSYSFSGKFIECCSCKEVCVTEITGKDAGCHGFGALQFSRGSYGGKSLAGSAVAFAWDSGKWVRIYVDASPNKQAAVSGLMKAMLSDWGALESVRPAKVKISSAGSAFTLEVDGGKTAKLAMKPVFGGDGKTPVTHTNLSSPMHSALMQGATKSASFADGHPFSLSATNGFFNFRDRMAGRI